MNTKSVPHIVITIRKQVTLEPELEAEIGSMRPAARRALAKKFSRWAHQLYVSAKILEGSEKHSPPPKRIHWIPVGKARRN